MSLRFLDYLPDPLNLDPESVIVVRRRLEAYLAELWPELDTRPNSVFGDIYLTPESAVAAACEAAMENFKSDLDLSNVATGRINNPDFVEAFLANFGVTSDMAVRSTGVVKLLFGANIQYLIGHDVTFKFGEHEFVISPEEDNPLVIQPVGSSTGKRILTSTGDGGFEVHIPVIGPPGSDVSDGETAILSESVDDLDSAQAAGSFDPGKLTESLISMASRAQKRFASISLTSRTGARSFVATLWPNLLLASATVTGDKEMLRSGINPLGIKEGALDLFVRSSTNYIDGETTLDLTYDVGKNVWVGQLTLPVVPAFFSTSDGIFQAAKFREAHGASTIYSKSRHPTVDNLGVSYSRHEVLGIEIEDTNPTNFIPSSNGTVTYSTPGVVTLVISGEYGGSKFSQYSQRSVKMRFDRLTELEGKTAIVANVKDLISGESGTVYFLPNTETNPNKGIVDFASQGYKNLFNGLHLAVVPTSGRFIPVNLLGLQFDFGYRGRTSSFTANYLYDPSLVKIDNILQHPDNKPVNVDVFTRSFIICHVTQFVITYRIRYGQNINLTAARDGIAGYVNGLGYPRQYQDTSVAMFLRTLGVIELRNISKRGTFYPSLARLYVDKEGNESLIPRLDTTDLQPPSNDFGIGARNVTYILEQDTIQFNAITA